MAALLSGRRGKRTLFASAMFAELIASHAARTGYALLPCGPFFFSILALIGIVALGDIAFNHGRMTAKVTQLVGPEVRAHWR